ncbi:MAG TPA: ABC transporter permease, partial [Anaerolineaceae bacterium]|nr:ABC transporter permease [Anaerolineaceae bacterium]
MNKTWLVFIHEYKRHVQKKSFLFGVLSMPLMVVVMVGIGLLTVWLDFNQTPVGYIDPTHLIDHPIQVPEKPMELFHHVEILPMESEEEAKAAFEDQTIQAYFILGDDYLSTGQVTLIKNAQTGTNVTSDFGDFLKLNLLQGQPKEIAKRLTEGDNLIIRSLDGEREMAADNWLSIMLPILSGVLFIIAVNISGSYLLQAVVEEKENRTMEIIVTSVSPTQLMTGKVLGDLLVGLTQLAIWILFVLIALRFIPLFLPIGEIPTIDVSYL